MVIVLLMCTIDFLFAVVAASEDSLHGQHSVRQQLKRKKSPSPDSVLKQPFSQEEHGGSEHGSGVFIQPSIQEEAKDDGDAGEVMNRYQPLASLSRQFFSQKLNQSLLNTILEDLVFFVKDLELCVNNDTDGAVHDNVDALVRKGILSRSYSMKEGIRMMHLMLNTEKEQELKEYLNKKFDRIQSYKKSKSSLSKEN